MLKSYKVRLYPNQTQMELIDKTIGCARFLFNQMLDERIKVYEQYKGTDILKKYKYKTEKEYKDEYEFLKDVSSRALQQSRIDLEAAYKNFYRRIRQGKTPGFPKFKSKHKCKWTYREPQVTDQIQIKDNNLKLLKLGWIKTKGFNNRQCDKIKSVTVTKTRSNQYHASVLVEVEDSKIRRFNKGGVIGLDLGLKEFAIDSNGNLYESILNVLFKKEKELKILQRHFSRKVKGSKRREKCRVKVAKKYEKIKNIRDYFQWHLANKLCSENQTIVTEKLKLSNMIKNRKLSHSISYASWNSFVLKLNQKAKEYHTQIVEADTFFASSRTCSNCGHKKNDLQLSDRTYNCNECGYEIDRDVNAAINLRNLSAEFVDYSRGETVRPRRLVFDFQGSFVEVITEAKA